MHAHDWHAQATALPAELPVPLTAAELAGMSEEARAWFADTLRTTLREQPIASPLHAQVSEELTRALDSALLEPPGARTIIALSAPWTAGKSTLIKPWAYGRYRRWLTADTGVDDNAAHARQGLANSLGTTDAEQSHIPSWQPARGTWVDLIPVFYLTLLSESGSKDLYKGILGFAGRNTAGAKSDVAMRAIGALRTHRARLVILDDAHMLRTASVTGRATLDAVKHLNTELGELGGVLVLVGADLAGGEALSDPQIRGRLAEHSFSAYEIDTDEGRVLWQRLLRSCEDLLLPYLPANQPGDLANRAAAYLWARTQGFVGDTAQLLIDATTAAIAQGRSLDRSTLDEIRLSQRAEEGRTELERGRHRPRTEQRREPRTSPKGQSRPAAPTPVRKVSR